MGGCQLLVFRGLGVVATALFALQAVWLFMDPPKEQNFWRMCHWIGQALLFIFVGAAGCYLEFKGGAAEFRKLFPNRILVFVFYLWLGCYAMDDLTYSSKQEALARATGILAWVVAAGNLVVCCSCDGGGSASARRESQEHVRGMSPVAPVVAKGAAPTATMRSSGSMRSTATPMPPPFQPDLDDVDLEDPSDAPVEPEGGWNTAWSTPFGGAK
mmetsp:Transcript_44621/g.125926  ORF Transcript_44621/g.125926 Transcript_44621/m.125926 type:complete len:214 (+) Transcript_44621:83-724(+)